MHVCKTSQANVRLQSRHKVFAGQAPLSGKVEPACGVLLAGMYLEVDAVLLGPDKALAIGHLVSSTAGSRPFWGGATSCDLSLSQTLDSSLNDD